MCRNGAPCIIQVELGMLMCVMGLDMLFMAGGRNPFVERLGGFLGGQSRVFPKAAQLGHQPQPAVRVGEVIADLYEFRNKIAHGKRVPQRYLEVYILMDDVGGRINVDNYYYAELMRDAGLFMLARALRTVFVEDLADSVKDEAKWRQLLKQYEHRYKSTALPPPKRRR